MSAIVLSLFAPKTAPAMAAGACAADGYPMSHCLNLTLDGFSTAAATDCSANVATDLMCVSGALAVGEAICSANLVTVVPDTGSVDVSCETTGYMGEGTAVAGRCKLATGSCTALAAGDFSTLTAIDTSYVCAGKAHDVCVDDKHCTLTMVASDEATTPATIACVHSITLMAEADCPTSGGVWTTACALPTECEDISGADAAACQAFIHTDAECAFGATGKCKTAAVCADYTGTGAECELLSAGGLTCKGTATSGPCEDDAAVEEDTTSSSTEAVTTAGAMSFAIPSAIAALAMLF